MAANKKKWNIKAELGKTSKSPIVAEIVETLLVNRGIKTEKEQAAFINPPDPYSLTPEMVALNKKDITIVVHRIKKAIESQESIIVYADYDADGITAGTVLWETLYALGANVLPYIPDRFEEGYGFSTIGIDRVKKENNATLIITVDHGISGSDKVRYAKSLGIDVIVTDHHTKPGTVPDCPILHTTALSGSGVSWFLAKTLLDEYEWKTKRPINKEDLVAVSSIGTIADLVPLIGPSRSLVKAGLKNLNTTKKVGLLALLTSSGLTQGNLGTYDVSHVIAPRLNAMGRLEHAIDALRLLCTTQEEKARTLAEHLGLTNKERQQLTVDTAALAVQTVLHAKTHKTERILFIAHESFNQGIIGLVAGKLVEEFYLPAIVLTRGEVYSKASARSITGFNIIDAIRACQDLLVDAGGHPMAAGFTVETAKLSLLQKRLEELAGTQITDDMLIRSIQIDCVLPFSAINNELYVAIQSLAPFGVGNPEPCFATMGVTLWDLRKIGADGKHLKLKINSSGSQLIDAVAFGMGDRLPALQPDKPVDIVYTLDKNTWNGKTSLQLKIRDILSD